VAMWLVVVGVVGVVVWLCGCVAVWLRQCVAAWLCDRPAVWLYVWMFGCVTV